MSSEGLYLWKEGHIILNDAFLSLSQNLYLETVLACINMLTALAGS
jgi:hypothetical protein